VNWKKRSLFVSIIHSFYQLTLSKWKYAGPTEWCTLFCVFHIPMFWVGSYSAFSVLLQPLTDQLYWALCCVDSCKKCGFCHSLRQCFVFQHYGICTLGLCWHHKGKFVLKLLSPTLHFLAANQHMCFLDCGVYPAEANDGSHGHTVTNLVFLLQILQAICKVPLTRGMKLFLRGPTGVHKLGKH
jgi:hypothetical protein